MENQSPIPSDAQDHGVEDLRKSWRWQILRLIRSAAIVYLLVLVCMMFLEEFADFLSV